MTETDEEQDLPLILTAELAALDLAFFDALRRQHFPPARNKLTAHLTLFHHLPGCNRAVVAERLASVARCQAPMPLLVSGLRHLGGGVAFRLESRPLEALRAGLARDFDAWLTRQDRQSFRPHITVQNKVAAAEADRLLDALSADFSPFTVTATGLGLWRYRGGPWEAAGRFAFAEAQPGGAIALP